MWHKLVNYRIILICMVLYGCTSPYKATESECLAKLRSAGYSLELGEPKDCGGTLVSNPYLLVGRWACTFEGKMVDVMPGRRELKIFEGSTVTYRRLLEFRNDGTFSLKDTGSYMSTSTDSGYEGRWKFSDGTLEFVYTKYNGPSFKGSNKELNITRQRKVFDCGNREILIEHPSRKACCDEWIARGSDFRVVKDGYDSRTVIGFDQRGYKVIRSFTEHVSNAYAGGMHIFAQSPQRYKYVGDVVATRPRAVSNVPQHDTGQKVRNNVETHTRAPSYSLDSFQWEKGSDFAASFVLTMKGECTIDAFFGIRQKFDMEIRNAYLQSHPSADSRHLQIDVRPNLENGSISGRVAVLTIVPASLTYDANTRRGKLAVRFNAGQAEEARAWIRKNIETLARDKNIALTTGQLPPAATYYSLGEKIDGNIMEIEFRTE